MGVRDEELNRLIRYAQGMGLSVNFKPYIRGSRTVAEWSTDGTQIIIYTYPKEPKISKILSLIHELGHHKAFIQNDRMTDPKVDEALEDEEEKKRSRKRILDYETSDSKHWEQIYKDTDCKFDINKLYEQRDFDIWCYEVYYETGEIPTGAMRKKKAAQLKEKYRS